MRLLVSLVLFFLIVSSVSAEIAPDVMVREVLAKIKESGNPAEIVNHVDWPEAFKTMPEQDKLQLKIKNPDEMREFFRQMLADPSATMKRNMMERVALLPADKQEEAKAAIEQMSEKMNAREAELKQRIKETEYTVGEAKVQGDTATVMLAQSYKGEKSEEKIELRKKNGEWMLPSVRMGQPQQAGAPAGAAAKAKPAVVAPPKAPKAAAAESGAEANPE